MGAPRYVVTIREWNVDPAWPESHFTFEPPEGAEKIESEKVPGTNGTTACFDARGA